MSRTDAVALLHRPHEAQNRFYGGARAPRSGSPLSPDTHLTVPGTGLIALPAAQ